MLILVAVTVTVAINGGLFITAKQTTDETQIEAEKEHLLSMALGAIGDHGEIEISKLDKTIKADGKFEGTGGEEGPEGVVYIDLANTESGSWNGYSFTITNTSNMIEKWTSNAYGTKNSGVYQDLWGSVEDNGWHVPSRDELIAFGAAFNISNDSLSIGYYQKLGLSPAYKSSSLNDPSHYWSLSFGPITENYGGLGTSDFDVISDDVRLSTTF